MARLNGINGKKIALDTVVFIYTLEGNFEFGDRAKTIFEAIEQGKCKGYASDLVLAELMVKPLREGIIRHCRRIRFRIAQFSQFNFSLSHSRHYH